MHTITCLIWHALGAGISGINAGKQLNDIGIKKYTIFEAGQGIKGLRPGKKT